MTARWGPGGPPPEAYSRVTNAERFRPLHEGALRLLDRLDRAFEVERTEAYGLDLEIEAGQQLGRATVRIAPRDPAAAPVVVAFNSFPGLGVRCGRWLVDRFPACGCDACDETAMGELDRLADLIANVTEGRFREAILLPLLGSAWYEYELGAPWQRRGRSRLTRARARELVGKGSRRIEWAPWS